MNLVLHEKYNVRWQYYFRLSKCVGLFGHYWWSRKIIQSGFLGFSDRKIKKKFYSKQYVLILYVIAKFTNRKHNYLNFESDIPVLHDL